jgi:hypothetical protein
MTTRNGLSKRYTQKSDYLITQRRKDEDSRALMRQATQYYAKMESQVRIVNFRVSLRSLLAGRFNIMSLREGINTSRLLSRKNWNREGRS